VSVLSSETVLKETEDHMSKSLEATKRELSSVRTGKATTALLDNLKVDYYGSPVPLRQVANVAAPEPRLLTIQPYEKSLIPVIEKAIRTSEMGLNPATDGNLVRIPIPALTEERRKDLVKVVRGMVEHGRVAIRNVRHHANDHLKQAEKSGEITEDQHKRDAKRLQDLTDGYIKKLDEVLKAKEAEIMEV
jgi:ribosome recycling factor